MTQQERLQTGLVKLGLPVLTEDVGQRLCWLLDELLRWNRHHNLTAVTDPAEGVEKHLLDSLTLLPLLQGAEQLLDLGSGAGLPGLVLKIVLPGLTLVSIDAVAKKIRFQRHVIRTLGLTGARAEQRRIESLGADPELAGGFDRVVFRALGSLETFLPLALPCLKPEGVIIAMKGAEGEAERIAARPLQERLGLGCESRRLVLPYSGAERYLLQFNIL